MIKDFWLKWLRWKMPDMIAARLSAAEAESSLSGQVGPVGDAALIRGQGEQFSSLAS